MLDAESWVEPAIDWCAAVGLPVLHARLRNDGELLTSWPAAPFETTPTDCFRLDDEYWVVQDGVGAIRFSAHKPRLWAFPSEDGDRPWFREVVARCWLPAIYPFWGRQVLHASAAAVADTGDVIAFTGPTHSGKSTTAYAIAQRPGWTLVADDSLAFAWSDAESAVRIHPLQNEARLRSASAEYFGKPDTAFEAVQFPPGRLRLRALYLLTPEASLTEPARITKMRAAESLPLLLQQAYALSFAIVEYNQQLMRQYARLATGVGTFRLQYRRSFDSAEAVYDAVERHVASDVQPSPAPPRAGRG